MKVCSLCEKQLGLMANKTADGFICDDCLKYISYRVKTKDADEKYLKKVYSEGKERAKGFEATAYLGNLYLDSVHGMFCYSAKGKNGTPASLGDVFKLTELKEIGLYITNVRNTGQNKPNVLCDVKLKVTTDKVNEVFTVISNKNCIVTPKGDGEYTVSEPVEVSMIRSMLNQMIDDLHSGMMKQLGEILKMQELAANKPKIRQDKEWALGVMFLANKDYSDEEIKAQYRKLSRVFHPDVNPNMSSEYMEMLNNAYAILK